MFLNCTNVCCLELLLHHQVFIKGSIVEGKEGSQEDAELSRTEADKVQKARYIAIYVHI